ncbi:MAG TPA: DUF4344 domain-containing metallopeptidase [Hyphomicrobiaceae bacterium]|nr:DUF4344 domain-containing metallopeptidase [Hyphomicrobiaceae bacterium]
MGKKVLLLAAAMLLAQGATAQAAEAQAAEAQPQRILIQYETPANAALLPLYEMLKQRRALEKLQEIFGPFRLPTDLTLKTVGCDGRANAWYQRPSITLCYEYLDEIRKNVPNEATPVGVTPADAVIGQFFYVVAHEFGHAVFDLLNIPSFGNAEDVADQFSTYLMLQFGKDEARRLVAGAAFSYHNAVQNSTLIIPLKAFSDAHGVPAQRFFNLLCVAYGADPKTFADVETYLPNARAVGCKREYNQVAFAFQQLVMPHVDRSLAQQVMKKSWLPEPAQPHSP